MSGISVENDPFPFNVFESNDVTESTPAPKRRATIPKKVARTVAALSLLGWGVRDLHVIDQNHISNIEQLDNEKQVSLGALPSVLPTAVANVVSRIFAIEVDYVDPATGTQAEAVGGTAVQLTDKIMLTAGHVILMDGFATSKGYCHDIRLADRENAEITNDIQGYTASSNSDNDQFSKIPDVGLIQMSSTVERPFSGPVQPLSLASEATAGEPVFFVNFETPINPNSTTYNQQQPIIFGGIVAAKQTNGDYEIADNLKSYTGFDQSILTPGGSGGAVFNRNGELLGLSEAGITLKNSSSPTYSLDKATYFLDGIRLESNSPGGQVGLTIVQPITQTLLAQFESRPLSANCT